MSADPDYVPQFERLAGCLHCAAVSVQWVVARGLGGIGRHVRSLHGKPRLGVQRDDRVVAARHVRAVGRLPNRTQVGALDHVGLVQQDPAPSRVRGLFDDF
jgi:hypothetical protein